MDGTLDERIWDQAEPVTDFVQAEPVEGQPASEPTEVRLLYDDRAIYIGVTCYDSEPSKIIIADSRRDSGLGDMDSFQIIFDITTGKTGSSSAPTRPGWSTTPRSGTRARGRRQRTPATGAATRYNDRTRRWSSNLRFQLVAVGGDGLYVVYNDTEGFSGLGPVNRAFIIKYSHLFDALR